MVGNQFLKRWAIAISLVILTLSSIFLYFSTQLTFDYDFEKFFPADDDEATFFYQHRDLFESDNDFLLIAIEREKGVFDAKFLQEVDRFTTEIKEVKRIRFAESITSATERIFYTGGFSSSIPFLTDGYDSLQKDSLRIYSHPELLNTLLARDGKSVCVYVQHEEFLSKKKSDELIASVEKLVEKFDFEKVRIAGRTIGQKYYVKIMTDEMGFFVALSVVLLVLFLWVAFRSLWGILLPQVVIILSVVWVVGLMGVFKEPINIILVVLPPIMFVVSMSDVIHLVSRYLDALRSGLDKVAAIRITVKEVGLSTFLTSITTAIGFYTLVFVNVEPIKVFGVVMGTGVLIAFIITILVLPILFYFFPVPKKLNLAQESSFWSNFLRNSFLFTLKKRKQLIIGFILFSGVMTIGAFQLQSNNFLMDDLKDTEPIKADFNYLDQHYGGIRPFELALEVKDSSKTVWDLEVLEEIEKVENYVKNSYGARVNLSLVQTLKLVNRSYHLGDSLEYKLPKSQREINKYKRPLRIAAGGKFIESLVDSTQLKTRISGAIPDLGNLLVTSKNKKLQQFIDSEINTKLIDVKLTGTAHLLDKNMRYLSGSLVKGILISVLIITVLMGILYRSFAMVFISLIPNLIPLLALAGIMGFFGVELKITTAIIFTIAFGIAVDDTIHFLSKFKLELDKGKPKLIALKNAYLVTGKAMILTTLILCSGFLMLLFSSFIGTFMMGVMITITLFLALVLDLSLLPILLLLFYHPKKD